MKGILAIIVTFNRKEMLKKCLSSLLQMDNTKFDILVIDNASTDGTRASIDSFIDNKGIIYLNTGKNLGGAGGFNLGLKRGAELGYKYLWIMDDDTCVKIDTLDYLLEAAEILNDNFGWLSSIVLWKDGKLCNMNIQRKGIKTKIADSGQDTIPAIMATFVSFFVKSETVKKYGLPISDFFIWTDDLEYSRRISMYEPSYVVCKSKVVHLMESNNKVGIEQDIQERMWRYKYLYRNEVYVFRREGIKGYLYLLSRLLLHTGRVLLKSENDKGRKIKIIWKSFFSGFRFDPSIEYVFTN